MDEGGRSAWAVPLVVIVALWGLTLVVLAAFLIAMSAIGQPFSSSALVAGIAVGIGAFVTLRPVLAWLRCRGTTRLRPILLSAALTMVAVAAWLLYLLSQPAIGP